MLILNAPCMASMSDEHLIASLYAQASPLTSTPAEMELLARLENAIDALDDRVPMEAVSDAVTEASAQYPGEDFLDTIIDRINALAKNLRGANKEEAESISNDLFDLGAVLVRAAEYGREKLQELEK
jgi:hypothetical protein